jgi:hypothetical protein
MGGKGSGGHNRKPTAQKLAEGNRGKRPLNLCEPKALPGEPQMPSGMTEQARAVWPEVVAMLKANEVLFQTDGLAIAALCSNLVLFWQADRAVQELGSVREWRMNPSVRVRSGAPRKSCAPAGSSSASILPRGQAWKSMEQNAIRRVRWIQFSAPKAQRMKSSSEVRSNHSI